MQDPFQALSFSLQANKGEFAVLLGSGVSRSAQIPTGWDITLDLVRKLAASEGTTAEPDPVAWYKARCQTEADPDYSKLLSRLFPTRALRQRFLEPHFEASESEREDGVKRPTKAHHAIASLVEGGHLKVIVTTNFDRLMEQALAARGIEPVVIATPHAAEGAKPLDRERCTIIKLHGDYKDTRILNTETELGAYKPAQKKLLRRVFEEYNLIVCGWSAAYDIALCDAFASVKSRSYATFWAQFGEPTKEAKTIQKQRKAQVIDITNEGADGFFEKLAEQVDAIERFSKPHPLTVEAAVATVKKYLSKEEYNQSFTTFLDDLTSTTLRAIEQLPSIGAKITFNSIGERLRQYVSICSRLSAVLIQVGYHGNSFHIYECIKNAKRLLDIDLTGFPNHVERPYCYFPSTLFLYSMGIGCVAKNNAAGLARFLSGIENHNMDSTFVFAHPLLLNIQAKEVAEVLYGKSVVTTAFNQWIQNELRTVAEDVCGGSKQYEYVFDFFEVLLALRYVFKEGRDGPSVFFPNGMFVRRSQNTDRIFKELEEDISIGNIAFSNWNKAELFGNQHKPSGTVLQLVRRESQNIRIFQR